MSARYEMHLIPDATLEAIGTALAVDPATISATVLAISNGGAPVGHAALRPKGDSWEVKRVVVLDSVRGQGVGAGLMNELERLTREAGVTRMVLQTGDRQPEAVRLYERLGYTPIPVYAPYDSVLPQSQCFEKVLA